MTVTSPFHFSHVYFALIKVLKLKRKRGKFSAVSDDFRRLPQEKRIRVLFFALIVVVPVAVPIVEPVVNFLIKTLGVFMHAFVFTKTQYYFSDSVLFIT